MFFLPRAFRFYQRTFPVFPSDATPTSFGGKLKLVPKIAGSQHLFLRPFPTFPCLQTNVLLPHISLAWDWQSAPGDKASCRCM